MSKEARAAAAMTYASQTYLGARGLARGKEMEDILAPVMPGFQRDTDEIIDAYLAALAKTHVIVPREPTEAMLEAGEAVLWNKADVVISSETSEEIYRAMLSASNREPEPQQSGNGDKRQD